MTLSSIQSLSDRELEAKVAGMLGWSRLQISRRDDSSEDQLCGVPPDGDGRHLFSVPSYSRSLDAATEIEREIEQRGLRQEYVNNLRKTIQTPLLIWGCITATARQRLEAALYTLKGQHTG